MMAYSTAGKGGGLIYAVDALGHDLVVYVRDQLPRRLQELVTVDVISDAYHLRTTARFYAEKDRRFECLLEMQDFGGRQIACKIPDSFLAHLSAVL
jgi:hypothetical protein